MFSCQSKDVYFYINYSLTKDRTYWMVFESNATPPEYDQKTKGLINVNDTLISGIYNPVNDSYTNFNDYLVNAEIGFGSTVASGISNWYAISGIASSTSMTVSSTGATLSNQNYVSKNSESSYDDNVISDSSENNDNDDCVNSDSSENIDNNDNIDSVKKLRKYKMNSCS